MNMDSMCGVWNLSKSGGPVPQLCTLVKEIWNLCQALNITLCPRWQRRNEVGMVRADILSKVDTEWRLRTHMK